MTEQIGMAGLGMILGGINDQRQIDQQRELQGMQIKGNKEMADYSQQKQKEMWDYTNYENQKKHMKAAGLNPALMYGMGGGGGSSLGSGASGSVSGGDAPKGGGEAMGMMQMALMDAQRKNIEASTEKTQAETPGAKNQGVISGVEAESRVANKEKQISADGWEYDKRIMSGEEANLNWEAMQTAIAGSMGDPENPLVKAKMAQLNKHVADLKSVQQDIINKGKEAELKTDQHELNEIEKDIKGFTADLSELGINDTTMGVVLKILGGLFGIRLKGADKGTTTERVSYDKKGRETSTTTRTTPNKKQ